MLRLNAGVSTSCRRMYKPTATSTVLARNGARHPQLNNCASDRLLLINRNAPMEKTRPKGAPNCGNIPYQPCLPGGAFSVASSTAPPHSPPKPIPCPTRHSARSTAAYTPMDA